MGHGHLGGISPTRITCGQAARGQGGFLLPLEERDLWGRHGLALPRPPDLQTPPDSPHFPHLPFLEWKEPGELDDLIQSPPLPLQRTVSFWRFLLQGFTPKQINRGAMSQNPPSRAVPGLWKGDFSCRRCIRRVCQIREIAITVRSVGFSVFPRTGVATFMSEGNTGV